MKQEKKGRVESRLLYDSKNGPYTTFWDMIWLDVECDKSAYKTACFLRKFRDFAELVHDCIPDDGSRWQHKQKRLGC